MGSEHLVMPAKAGIQYAAASRLITAVSGYWIIRFADDDAGGQAASYRRTLKKSPQQRAALVSPTAE